MPTSDLHEADPGLLAEHQTTPMGAVEALYSDGDPEISEAVVASLSAQVFGGGSHQPASGLRRVLATPVHRMLQRTTRRESRREPDGQENVRYRNRLLERSGHPYAETLLQPSASNSGKFVEGGDPMNAPYMMISPEIRKNAATWDRLLLDSVQGRDVQLRFIWETRIAHRAAKALLDDGGTARIKAAAAGTGLSLILVWDRLVREGYDPARVSAVISDRDAANVTKTGRLLGKLESTRGSRPSAPGHHGISARVEDLLDSGTGNGSPEGNGALFDIITLVGILEYFHGFTSATTEEHLDEAVTDQLMDGVELVRRVGAMTSESGTLIANSYRVEAGAKILEVFGKRLRYRTADDLSALLETAGFFPTGQLRSGHIYDVEAFAKRNGSS